MYWKILVYWLSPLWQEINKLLKSSILTDDLKSEILKKSNYTNRQSIKYLNYISCCYSSLLCKQLGETMQKKDANFIDQYCIRIRFCKCLDTLIQETGICALERYLEHYLKEGTTLLNQFVAAEETL